MCVIPRTFKSGRGEKRSNPRRRCGKGSSAHSLAWEGLDLPVLGLEMKEKSHQPRKAGGCQRLKKARKQIWSLYWFPRGAVMKYCPLHSLKGQKFIPSQIWRLTVHISLSGIMRTLRLWVVFPCLFLPSGGHSGSRVFLGSGCSGITAVPASLIFSLCVSVFM